MKSLFIVSSANDVFIYNLCKNLKSRLDITIDIIEYRPKVKNNANYAYDYYNSVRSIKVDSYLCKIPVLGRAFKDYVYAKQLKRIIGDEKYDFIQCHYFLKFLVFASSIRNNCDYLFVTFWGGEIRGHRILLSNYLFLSLLRRFLRRTTAIINSQEGRSRKEKLFKGLNLTYLNAQFGSSSVDYMKSFNKNESKKIWEFSQEKVTIMIGYSGKMIHNHLKILEAIIKLDDSIKKKIHLIAPMTRGADNDYMRLVEVALQESGCTYTFIHDIYLEDKDIATLRLATDVTLQLSDSDGFSRSIIECLCAGSLVIYGRWLRLYESTLNNYGFYAQSADSIEEGVKMVCDFINDRETIKGHLDHNRKKAEQFGWDVTINDWVSIYQKYCKKNIRV